MKKKLWAIFVLLLVCVCCVFGFTACDSDNDLNLNPDNPTHTHEYTETVVEPTCTTDGYTLHKCTCASEYRDNYIPAIGHVYGEWETLEEPTCTETGTGIRYCVHDRTHTETKTLRTIGHNYEWVTTKATTCTENGAKSAVCTLCSATKTEETVATGHEYSYSSGSFNESKKTAKFQCVKCENKLTQAVNYDSYHSARDCRGAYSTYKTTIANGIGYTQSISFNIYIRNPGQSHTIDPSVDGLIKYVAYNINTGGPSYEYNDLLDVQFKSGKIGWNGGDPADCMGYKLAIFTCAICEQDIVIRLSGAHTFSTEPSQIKTFEPDCTAGGYDEKLCVLCNQWVVVATFDALGHTYLDGKCVVCGVQIETTPNEYFSFTLLSDNTYEIKAKDKNNLPEEVVVPSIYNGKQVTRIGEKAFYDCSNLKTIIISDGIKIIGDSAFYCCNNLVNLTIFDSIEEIGIEAFKNCPNLKYKEYENGCYLGNANNSYLVFVKPKSTDITEFILHANTKVIAGIAFEDCAYLSDIVVPESNKNYKSIYGNLYSKDGAKLIQYAIGKTITEFSIPVGVVIIEQRAFYGCNGLMVINIPNTVVKIEEKAFSKCLNLRFVYMSENVAIDKDVFRESIYVETLYSHELIHVERQEATCYKPGNIEHYKCVNCGQFFADQEGKNRLYNITITEAHNFQGGTCVVCGSLQKEIYINYIEPIGDVGKFALGTLENAIGLPNTIVVKTMDNLSHVMNIIWDLSEYDKSKVGIYQLVGYIQYGNFMFVDGLEDTISVYIEIVEYMKGTADIVFILDISGSMGDEVANVKNNIVNFAQKIDDKGVSARWSVITFSDFTCSSASNEKTTIIKNGSSDWFTDVKEYKNAISGISLANGGDEPETDIDGLMMATTLSTRKDVRTFYILLTDASYKVNNNFGIGSLSEVINILHESDITASVITSSRLKSTYSSLFESTNGIWSNINSNFSNDLYENLVPIILNEVIS